MVVKGETVLIRRLARRQRSTLWLKDKRVVPIWDDKPHKSLIIIEGMLIYTANQT